MTFLNIRCHNLQDLEGASCYLAGVKKLNSWYEWKVTQNDNCIL